MITREHNDHDYVPAAMRPFTYQIAPGVARVRHTRSGDGARHWVVFYGRIVGEILEGKESCYYRDPSGAGKMYPSVTDVDAVFSRTVQK